MQVVKVIDLLDAALCNLRSRKILQGQGLDIWGGIMCSIPLTFCAMKMNHGPRVKSDPLHWVSSVVKTFKSAR